MRTQHTCRRCKVESRKRSSANAAIASMNATKNDYVAPESYRLLGLSFMSATALVTTPTSFTYSLDLAVPSLNALRVTATGTGFEYAPGGGDPIAGVISVLSLSVDLDVDVGGTDVPVTYLFQEAHELSQDIAEIGLDITQFLSDTPVGYVGFDVTVIGTQIVADLSGTILEAPNPMQVYSSAGLTVLGTDVSDHITQVNVARRIDTLAGDDVVVVETLQAGEDLQVLLRRGDDLFFSSTAEVGSTTTITGGVGNDRLLGNASDDFLRGGQDNDILLGAFGDDRLAGGAQDDFMFGGGGDDQLFGGVGRDVLNAGIGQNASTGGLGRDVFVVDFGLGQSRTIVHDFADGLDTLHFTNFGFTDISASDASALFDANSVQDGADTVLTYLNDELVLKNVTKADITADDFYDKPWLLITEIDVYLDVF